jgi:hypothetical protein
MPQQKKSTRDQSDGIDEAWQRVEKFETLLKSHQALKDQDSKWLVEAERLWCELEAARKQLEDLRRTR